MGSRFGRMWSAGHRSMRAPRRRRGVSSPPSLRRWSTSRPRMGRCPTTRVSPGLTGSAPQRGCRAMQRRCARSWPRSIQTGGPTQGARAAAQPSGRPSRGHRSAPVGPNRGSRRPAPAKGIARDLLARSAVRDIDPNSGDANVVFVGFLQWGW